MRGKESICVGEGVCEGRRAYVWRNSVCEGRRAYVWGKVCVRGGEHTCRGRCV